MKKAVLLFLFLIILAGCGAPPALINVDLGAPATSTPIVATTTPGTATTPTPSKSPPQAGGENNVKPPVISNTAAIPAQFDLKMAFASQAPLSNWDAMHEETCEEASMVIVDKYLRKEKLDKDIMEEELQRLVKWEEENGYKVDLTATETVQVLADYFGVTAHLETRVTADRIKYEISQGRPVIIPAAGRLLGNPNFTGLGPIYHMFVVRGYDSRNFITNDVGTRKGERYPYAYNVLLNAVHDWDHAYDGAMSETQILQGDKVMVVVDGVK